MMTLPSFEGTDSVFLKCVRRGLGVPLQSDPRCRWLCCTAVAALSLLLDRSKPHLPSRGPLHSLPLSSPRSLTLTRFFMGRQSRPYSCTGACKYALTKTAAGASHADPSVPRLSTPLHFSSTYPSLPHHSPPPPPHHLRSTPPLSLPVMPAALG